MAKGQIHMGKNGPEKCSVDTSNPRSRGCPYEATGHYSSADEALDSYATLNRVDPSELKEIVSDGASPKDAVGLIRSGYGRDYLTAAKRDRNSVPDTALEDKSAEYLDARTRVVVELQQFSPNLQVKIAGGARGSTVLIQSEGDGDAGKFSYAVTEGSNGLKVKDELGYPKITSDGAEAVLSRLQESAAEGNDSELKQELQRMIRSSKGMFAEEKNREG